METVTYALHTHSLTLIHTSQVPLGADNLNEGDCFILDAGTKIITFFGQESSPFEKMQCNSAAENLENTRNGKSETVNISSDDTGDDADLFWQILGGKPETI